MAIEIMIIGLPRSGTSWAAAWLGLRHDPLSDLRLEELGSLPDRGISDTGIYMFPEWLNAHPARKVILLRDPREILDSARANGLVVRDFQPHLLGQIRAPRLPWTALWREPDSVLEALGLPPLDEEGRIRHAALRALRVTAIPPTTLSVQCRVNLERARREHAERAGRAERAS